MSSLRWTAGFTMVWYGIVFFLFSYLEYYWPSSIQARVCVYDELYCRDGMFIESESCTFCNIGQQKCAFRG